MKSPGEIIRDYIMAFRAHTGCNPPCVEYRYGRFIITFADGDRKEWPARRLEQFTNAWNRWNR